MRSNITAANDVIVSGFNEQPPDYPGGMWIVRGERVLPLFSEVGVFGLSWWASQRMLFGATRVDWLPLVAFKVSHDNTYVPVPVAYRNYIPARRAHGIQIFNDRLYVVATQGDPDSVLCTNEDFAGVYVGKVIISKVEVNADRVLIRDSVIWNPYQCDHHHHYNDILIDRDFIYLASFSTCNARKQYIDRGAVTRFTHGFSGATIITDELVAPHSLQMWGNRLYVCSSSTASVISVSSGMAAAGVTLEFKTINNFVRGLNVTAEHFLIGLNRSAGRTNSAHLTEPINGVLKFNRRDGTTTRIEMPSDCDNVYSILSLP